MYKDLCHAMKRYNDKTVEVGVLRNRYIFYCMTS